MSSSDDADRALAAAAAASSSSPTTDPRKVALFSALCNELLTRGDSIVLYDGICLVCNRFIQFVADRDPARHVHFAPLQSELGQWIIQRKDIPAMDSMLLIASDGDANAGTKGATQQHTAKSDALDAASWFCRTNAALRILASLHPLWLFSLLWIVLWVPASLRDPFYKLFASLRYRLFGVVDPSEGGASCRMVTKQERARYLEYVVKDREKERNKKEKETTAAAAGPSAATATAPVSAAIPSSSSSTSTSGSLLNAPSTDEICAQTDRELELAHGHTHSPTLRARISPTDQPSPAELSAPLSSAAGELKQRKAKNATEASS